MSVVEDDSTSAEGRGSMLLAGWQFTTAVLWLLCASAPPAVAQVPDILVDMALPGMLVALCAAGILRLRKVRPRAERALLAGTALSGAIAGFAVALLILGSIVENALKTF